VFSDLHEDRLSHIRSLLKMSVQWDSLLRMADQHGTSSLLYQNLARIENAVPPAVLASLRQSYERNIHKTLFLARELIRILDRLDGLGIEVVAYKGIVLSEVYYGDMVLRRSGDMDLFVGKQTFARIKSAVRDLGYTRAYCHSGRCRGRITSIRDTNALSTILREKICLSCSGRCNRRFYAVDFDMDGVFQRAVTVWCGPTRENACTR